MRCPLPVLALCACGSAVTPDAAPTGQTPSPAEQLPSPAPRSVAATSLQPGPVRHALSPEQRKRIEVVQKVLAEVDPSPLEQWLEDFSRDLNPDREIETFEAISAAFTTFTAADHNLAPSQRAEAYAVLLARTGAPADDVLANFPVKHLTHEQVRAALNGYTLEPRPIVVTPSP